MSGIVEGGLVPDAVLSYCAMATVFTIMFHLGVMVAPGEYRAAWRNPGLMLRGLFCALVAVPVVVIVIARAFDLSRAVQVGLVLMAISPGAPVALRRALDASGNAHFAPALQLAMAVLAVVSMPLSVALLDEVYAGHAAVAPDLLAKQVFVGQLLPLTLGMLARTALGGRREAAERILARLASTLLVAFVAVALIDIWRPVATAGWRTALAIVACSLAALGLGHWLGGPDPSTRTALAVCSAARNAGLAILVASVNGASPEIKATLLAYLVVSALTVTPYVVWRRGKAEPAQNTNLP
ncbi:MAG TPA: bile acid:sodium symporter [Usitatibacter sp.]|nr:bile acid:sodium symporter [Usitatibacter sp.]